MWVESAREGSSQPDLHVVLRQFFQKLALRTVRSSVNAGTCQGMFERPFRTLKRETARWNIVLKRL